MNSMRKWMLGAAVAAGAFGLGATSAQAAEFGVYVRGPVAYVPPCPGPGYVWVAGYQSNGYWVPGRWDFRGGYRNDYVARYDGRRDFDRGRGWDRGRDHDRDRDHDRFRR
jgi:hypothetical protein